MTPPTDHHRQHPPPALANLLGPAWFWHFAFSRWSKLEQYLIERTWGYIAMDMPCTDHSPTHPPQSLQNFFCLCVCLIQFFIFPHSREPYIPFQVGARANGGERERAEYVLNVRGGLKTRTVMLSLSLAMCVGHSHSLLFTLSSGYLGPMECTHARAWCYVLMSDKSEWVVLLDQCSVGSHTDSWADRPVRPSIASCVCSGAGHSTVVTLGRITKTTSSATEDPTDTMGPTKPLQSLIIET